MSELKRFGVSIHRDLVEAFDGWCRKHGYPNRSEAIRDLMRDRLVEEEWRGGSRAAVGTLSLVYDHHRLELPKKLTEMQHRFEKDIVSTLHVHLDHHNCLEIVVFRGPGRRIQEAADLLRSLRGVKHGKLHLTTSGESLP